MYIKRELKGRIETKVKHYYRIHHRKRPITTGLFRTDGDSLSPPVPNGPGGDANISPPVRKMTRR